MNESKNEDTKVRMITRKELIDLGCNQVVIDHVFKNGRGKVDVEVLAKQCAKIDGKKLFGMKELLAKLDPPYEGEVLEPEESPTEMMARIILGTAGRNYTPPTRGPGSRSKA